MTKLKFILTLHERLAALPSDEVEERLKFYSEMIEDRMEEGLSEEDAVAAVGSVDDIAAQIEADIGGTEAENNEKTEAKEETEPLKAKKQWKAWEIVLLILGSPLWLSLVIAVLSTILSVYVSLWAAIISLWATFGSLIACAVAGTVGGIVSACLGNVAYGVAMVGMGLVCAGLAILLCFGCIAATKATVLLAKKLLSALKKSLQ